jgi:toxin ParE1/3/4
VIVKWHRSALADLFNLTEFLSAENPNATRRILDEIEKQIDLLARHPHLGRPGRIPGTRERAVTGTPFIAVYQVTDSIFILRLLHGARRWPPSAQE